jgi:PIN domain nuclease of toxin-antitoxin system
VNKEEANFRATHFVLLRRKDGVWFKDKTHFRGLNSAEAAAIEAGLQAGVDFLVSERSWAEFFLKELNDVGNTTKPTPMLKIVKGCDDTIT